MKLLLLSPAIGRECRDAMPRNIKIELRIVAVFLSGIILGCSSNRFSVFFIPVRRFHCDVCDFRMSEKPHKLMLCDTIVNEIVGHCHCVSRWTGTEATNNHPLIIYWSLWLVRKIHYCCSAAHSLRLHRFRLRYGTGNRSLIDLNSIRQLASAIMWIGEAFAMFVDIKMVESESFCSEEKDDWGAQQTDCSFLRKDAAPNFSNIEYYSMRKFVYIISNISQDEQSSWLLGTFPSNFEHRKRLNWKYGIMLFMFARHSIARAVWLRFIWLHVRHLGVPRSPNHLSNCLQQSEKRHDYSNGASARDIWRRATTMMPTAVNQ